MPDPTSLPPQVLSANPADVTPADVTPDKAILGLSTNALAGLTVEEVVGNKTAITMLMHYYKVLVDDNNTLKNDANTYKTYVDGYESKRNNSKIGAILLTLSNIFIGLGANLLTSHQIGYGFCVFVPGLALVGAGLYFTLSAR